ncbi:MAG: LacI family transcriptional regulator [Arthrobacter sp.]|jgi:LacI family transcriptional regulator|nr:LacI family transcriptional regulator [Arthrobacter sp.]
MTPSNATRPTLRTVAAAAGVSTATASYVLSGKDASIPADTAARVLTAAKEQGYRPNRAARAMRTGRTGLVLLSLNMMSDPWSLGVSESVGQRAAENGLAALVQAHGAWFDTITQVQPDVAYVDSPAEDAETTRQLGRLVAAGQRLVVFSERLEPAGFDVVRSAAAPGSELALGELLEHTGDVAFLTPAGTVELSRERRTRYTPYREAVEQGRVERDLTTLYDGSRAGAFRAAVGLLESSRRPAAIAANTDYAALAAISAAQFLGLKVPEDLLVTGLGNTDEGALSTPSLTSAGPEDFYERQARIVVDAAARDLGDGTVHEFEWLLHRRASTTPPDPRGA